jgi:homoserine kinase
LPTIISLEIATKQWANLGSLVHALHVEDYELFSESLVDYIVEPHRSKLIPDFDKVKQASALAGALGCGISGSGPSMFTFCKGEQIADNVSNAISEIYKQTQIPYHVYSSKINTHGVKIL